MEDANRSALGLNLSWLIALRNTAGLSFTCSQSV